jgi:hypothetical protein
MRTNRTIAHLSATNAELVKALQALTIQLKGSDQLCFRTANGVPMGMSRKQERLARAALNKAKGEQ